jgi:hypothetical protein
MPIARRRSWLLALLLACAAQPAAAAAVESGLGTLFYTPDERARLDRMRRGEAVVQGGDSIPGAREVTGFVKRSDGRATIWIDGIPVQASAPRARALLDPKAVRGYGRDDNSLRVERAKPR